jgi:hypothetical protein
MNPVEKRSHSFRETLQRAFLPIKAQLLSKAAHAYSGDATFRTDAIVTLGLSSTMVRWNTARARDEILCKGATTATDIEAPA